MLSSYAGHTSLTHALLQKGAEPNIINDLGQSILAGAVFKAHDEIVRLLMEGGADPRMGTPSAIQAAHVFGRKEVFGVLGTKAGDVEREVPAVIPDVKASTGM